MKNKLATYYIILLSIATIITLYIPKNEVTAKEDIVIPNEAIRLRILANSDSEADQQLKRKVRDAVNAEITNWVQNLTSLEEARTIIKRGQPQIQKIAEAVVEAENSSQTVNVKFDRVQFPTKLYGQFLYPAGEYEAILITLGQGEGANWWCVLFPPLCFLDFSNGVAVSDGFEEEPQNQPKEGSSENPKEKSSNKKVAKSAVDEKLPQAETKEASTIETNDTETEKPVTKTEETNIENQQLQPKPETNKKLTNLENKDQNSAIKETNAKEPSSSEKASKADKEKKAPKPVYTGEDEQEVEVKFFVKELWIKIFS